ncbi:hypothetical protein ACFPYI_21380 [Halomarina salina]|uniref:Uncharacterized protein n=1 Tax=Halomarina salina TaxID=1872699 RepID=A0ABD5RU80_9EURY|nr:hypothetical protein [Halomarina salina]
MADSTTQTGEQDAPGERLTGDQSDSQREPGRNESMNQSQRENLTDLVRSGDPIALAAIASVALSLFTFYGRKNKQQGIFVGLWAPTLLAVANYVDRRANEDGN